MNTLYSPSTVSPFMLAHLPDFFDHFGINFCIDGPQLEYFVYQKKTGLDISCSLTVNFDYKVSQINVMTFYPGLYLHSGTRYLSAVCFFMIMQHFSNFYNIKYNCRICLNTRKSVFDVFYASLKDFNFHIQLHGKEDFIAIESSFLSLNIDTKMIVEIELVNEYLH